MIICLLWTAWRTTTVASGSTILPKGRALILLMLYILAVFDVKFEPSKAGSQTKMAQVSPTVGRLPYCRAPLSCVAYSMPPEIAELKLTAWKWSTLPQNDSTLQRSCLHGKPAPWSRHNLPWWRCTWCRGKAAGWTKADRKGCLHIGAIWVYLVVAP